MSANVGQPDPVGAPAPLGRRVANGALWLAASRITGQVFGLASTIVVARFIAPSDYGVFAAAMSLLIMVSAIAELPVSQALIHLQDVSEDDYDTAWTIGVLRGGLLAAALAAAAYPMAWIISDERVAPVVMALAAYLLLLGLRNSRIEHFARQLAFGREAVIEVASKVGSLVAAATIAILFRTHWALVAGLLAGAAVQVGFSFAMRPIRPRFTLVSFRRLFDYSVWLGGAAIASRLYGSLEAISLGRIVGTAALGSFSLGTQVATRVTEGVMIPLSRSLFAGFSQIQSDPARLRAACLNAMSATAAVVFPIAVALGLLAEPIVLVLIGENWRSAIPVVAIIGWTTLSHFVFSPMFALCLGTGRSRTLFIRSAVFLVLYLPGAIWVMSTFGLAALLLFKLSAMAGLLIVDLLIVRDVTGLGVSQQLRAVTRSAASAAAMGGAFLMLADWIPSTGGSIMMALHLTVQAGFGGALYLAVHIGLWVAMGRPDGVEAKAQDAALHVIGLARRWRASRA